jgi:hypothetical protein
MTYIIGISGRKQSGKSTCADYIANVAKEKNKTCKIYSFADPLKQDICMSILGLTEQQCYGTDDDKNTVTDTYWDNKQLTARELMQFIGTDIFRKMQSQVWVNATVNKIKKDNIDIAIVADCRFPNEVSKIIENNGVVIRLTRDLFHSDHISEVALDLDKYDWINFSRIIPNHKLSILEQNKLIYDYLSSTNLI